MSTWIDFKALRSKLSFVDVLKHYGMNPKVKGERAYAFCPLPSHPARTDGGKRTASLSVNLTRNIFQCFGCKASGNVLDFCIRMEGADPNDPKQFRSAAMKIAQTFGLSIDGKPNAVGQANDVSQVEAVRNEPPPVTTSLPVVVNSPLDFELKHLDPTHSYLRKRGFTTETIAHFGLGFCSKGMMQDRIAIPLHNTEGRLIGYAGRIVDDAKVNNETPKYLFPGTREREGKRCEFHKSEVLYNMHRIDRPIDDLIVVEGFASVWWLHQQGFPNGVALMGSSCSKAQADLIVSSAMRVWIFADGDEAGRNCALSLLTQIAPYRWVQWAHLSAGQPTDLTADQLAALLKRT